MQALPIISIAHDLVSLVIWACSTGPVVIIAQVDSPVSPALMSGGAVVISCMLPQVTSSWRPNARSSATCHTDWCKRNKTEAPRDLTSHLSVIKERGYEEKESYEVEGSSTLLIPSWTSMGMRLLL